VEHNIAPKDFQVHCAPGVDPADVPLTKWADILQEVTERAGKTINIDAERSENWVRDAGTSLQVSSDPEQLKASC
jgi:hypothetical protein